jgi:hypothetical protein
MSRLNLIRVVLFDRRGQNRGLLDVKPVRSQGADAMPPASQCR